MRRGLLQHFERAVYAQNIGIAEVFGQAYRQFACAAAQIHDAQIGFGLNVGHQIKERLLALCFELVIDLRIPRHDGIHEK